MSSFSIVVPVFHNARSLPDLLAEFQAVAVRNPDDDFEFIFVDDGSRDDSFDVLKKLAASEPRMKVAKLSRNFGSNPAVMAGLSLAKGDAVGALAADLQDPPALLHDMISRWREGHKVVIAARRGRGDPFPTSLAVRYLLSALSPFRHQVDAEARLRLLFDRSASLRID